MSSANSGKMQKATSNQRNPLTTRASSFDIGKQALTAKKATTVKNGASQPTTKKKSIAVAKKSVPTAKTKVKPKYNKDLVKNFDDMIDGDLSFIPPLPKSMVKIFLSSTFSDMRAERNTLARSVYPHLRDICSKRDLDFQVVDMRWGVTEDSQNDHSVERLCLLEVANCQKQSLGPNFIVLSGNRYGFRPIHIEFEMRMFETIRDMAAKLGLPDKQLLEDWYKLDKNSVPNVYLLQNIKSKFTFFGDFSPGCDELREKDTAAWWKTFEALQVIMRKSATEAHKEGKFTEYEKHQFFLSVTELEIQDGILNADDVDTHCLVYRRDFNNLQGENLMHKTAPRYIECVKTDAVQTVDEEVAKLRNSLFEKKVAKKLNKSNIKSYSISWSPSGIDPEKHKEDQVYLESFCNDFVTDCVRLINQADGERSCPINESNYYTDYTETIHHLKFCLAKCDSFCGQEEVLKKVKAYILNEKSHAPLVMHAESGLGKTSISAMIMKNTPVWLSGKPHVKLIRFLGTTPNTNNIEEVLFSVLGQLADAFDLIIPTLNYVNMKAVQDYAPRFLRQVAAAAKMPVVILLDSIDQLDNIHDAYNMKWLPLMLPSNIKLIISTLPTTHGILKNMKKLLPNPECYVEVPALSEKTAGNIMEVYLRQRKRTITEEQNKHLLSVFRHEATPLFLKLLLDEAWKWKSYTLLEDIDLALTVKKAINKLFEKLEKKFGLSLVSHALGFITVGLAGLSEFEIEDALSCDDVVLNDVYKFHDPPVPGIVRIPPVLWARIYFDIQEYLAERMSYGKTTLNWYHRQFIETARERYLSNGKDTELHAILTEIFLQDKGVQRTILLKKRNNLTIKDADRQVTPQPFSVKNRRKLACLQFHANRSVDILGKDFVKSKILCNFSLLCTSISAFSVGKIVQTFSDFLDQTADNEIEILRSFVTNSKDNLTQQVRFAFCLVGSLNPSGEHLNLVQLVVDAWEFLKAHKKPLLIPYFPCMAPRPGVTSALLTSVLGISDILAQTANSLLLQNTGDDETDPEEVRSSYSIFSTDRQDMMSLEIPKMPNTIGQTCMNDTCIYFASAKALTAYNFKKQKTSEVAFEKLMPQASKSAPGKLVTFVANSEASTGALVFATFVILIDLQKMTLSQKCVLDTPRANFHSCLLTNDGVLIAMGSRKYINSGNDSAESENPYFICRFDANSDKPSHVHETAKCLDFNLKAFADGENTLFIATSDETTLPESNGETEQPDAIVKRKMLRFDVNTLSVTRSFTMESKVTQMIGHPDKSEAAVLSEKGAVHWLTSEGTTLLGLKHSVVSMALMPVGNILLLSSENGTVTLYRVDEHVVEGAFPAFTVSIKYLKLFDETLVAIGSNDELKAMSIKSLLQDIKMGLSNNKEAEVNSLNDLMNVSAIAVSEAEDELYTCTEDGFLYVWDNNSLKLLRKFNLKMTGHTLHALKTSLVIHDINLGTVKIFDPYTGENLLDLPNTIQNVLDSVLNPHKTMLYLISSTRKEKQSTETIHIIDLVKQNYVKAISLQSGLTFIGVKITLSQNERYLILKSTISEAEFAAVKKSWKSGGFGEQNHRNKFHAIDLQQSTGALLPCNRRLSKIPMLGNNIVAGGMNTMLLTTRRWVLFWDIPTGKCDQKHSKDVKEPYCYSPTWLGQQCTGSIISMEHDRTMTFIATGSENGYMFVYTLSTGLPPGKKKPASKHDGKVHTIAISPNSRWIASACTANVLKLWDSSTVTEHFSVRLGAKVKQLLFNHSSDRLILYTGTNTSTRVLIFTVKT